MVVGAVAEGRKDDKPGGAGFHEYRCNTRRNGQGLACNRIVLEVDWEQRIIRKICDRCHTPHVIRL